MSVFFPWKAEFRRSMNERREIKSENQENPKKYVSVAGKVALGGPFSFLPVYPMVEEFVDPPAAAKSNQAAGCGHELQKDDREIAPSQPFVPIQVNSVEFGKMEILEQNVWNPRNTIHAFQTGIFLT